MAQATAAETSYVDENQIKWSTRTSSTAMTKTLVSFGLKQIIGLITSKI